MCLLRRGHVPMKYHTCFELTDYEGVVKLQLNFNYRLTIKAKCPMVLHKFPLDAQSCPLLIGSYAYQAKDVVYIWRKGVNQSVTANADLELSQYVLKTIVMGFANGTREGKEGALVTCQNHKCYHNWLLQVNFHC